MFLYDYQIKASLLDWQNVAGRSSSKTIPTRVPNPTDHQFWLCISAYMGLRILNYIHEVLCIAIPPICSSPIITILSHMHGFTAIIVGKW